MRFEESPISGENLSIGLLVMPKMSSSILVTEIYPNMANDLSYSNGRVEIAVEALVLVEVLADVLSCGSIGNIKISHLHCSASIATIGNVLQYKSIGYVQMLGIGFLL